MRVIFLGTGTSHGVPMVGCDCDVCRSADPRDSRLRPSIVVETDDGMHLLVDTTPDLRTQALTHNVRQVDAVLFTHTHADHIMGLDEVRRYNALSGRSMACFGDPRALGEIRRVFAYVFAGKGHTDEGRHGGGVPAIDLWALGGPFCVGRQEIVPVPVRHGHQMILGYRFGRFAYLTDCSEIPESSFELLRDLDVLVLDALRRRPHPTHFSLDQAVQAARRIGARQTLFTHICHDLGHEATCRSLPVGMALGYDGQRLDIGPSDCRVIG